VISFLPTCLGSEQKTRQLCTSSAVPTGVDLLVSSTLNAYGATFNKFLWLPFTFERDFGPPMLTFHLQCCWTMGPCSSCGDLVFFRSIIFFEGCLQDTTNHRYKTKDISSLKEKFTWQDGNTGNIALPVPCSRQRYFSYKVAPRF